MIYFNVGIYYLTKKSLYEYWFIDFVNSYFRLYILFHLHLILDIHMLLFIVQ